MLPNGLCLGCASALWPKLGGPLLGNHALMYLWNEARARKASPADSFKH